MTMAASPKHILTIATRIALAASVPIYVFIGLGLAVDMRLPNGPNHTLMTAMDQLGLAILLVALILAAGAFGFKATRNLLPVGEPNPKQSTPIVAWTFLYLSTLPTILLTLDILQMARNTQTSPAMPFWNEYAWLILLVVSTIFAAAVGLLTESFLLGFITLVGANLAPLSDDGDSEVSIWRVALILLGTVVSVSFFGTDSLRVCAWLIFLWAAKRTLFTSGPNI
jgi:hypothetical protein